MIVHTVPQGVRPMPVSRYLARAYPLTDVREAFKRRDVKVNGARRGGDFPVAAGDRIEIYLNLAAGLDVLYEGGGLLVVTKPQGLPVDADRDGIGADTALARARAIHPAARLCHRLDAQTGGALIFATDEGAYASTLAAFRARQVGKRYAALVGGAFQEAEGVYQDRLAKDAEGARVRIVARGGLPVETRWRVEGPGGDGLVRMSLTPVTGRTHQLRVHMAHHGHPILGDDKYGDRTLNRRYRTKLCLWCEFLSLEGLSFHAPAPDWLNHR